MLDACTPVLGAQIKILSKQFIIRILKCKAQGVRVIDFNLTKHYHSAYIMFLFDMLGAFHRYQLSG